MRFETIIEDDTIYVVGDGARLEIGPFDDVLDHFAQQNRSEGQLRKAVRNETHSPGFYGALRDRDGSIPEGSDRRYSARMGYFLGGVGLRVGYGGTVP